MDVEEIDIDLERCERVLRDNNYMEIIIAIEELQDKYRDKILNINENENDTVWNYSKKDLERIEKCIVNYKIDIISKERLKNIDKKLEDLRKYINDNIENKDMLQEITNVIEVVNKKDINLDKKYEELKVCFSLLKNLDRKVSVYILELIAIIISD